MSSFRLICALLVGGVWGLAATPASGQPTQDSDVVDRVVAIVGDSVVLMTQVLEEIEQLRFAEGFTMPTDPAAYERLFEEVLDGWVSRVMLLQAAARDTLIQVDEARVDEIVSDEIDTRAQAMGGQQGLQEALVREGLSLAEFRDIVRHQIRRDQIQQMYIQRQLQVAAPVEVTEDEMLALFQSERGQLQQRPKTITFEQVVLRPQPSDSAKEAARLLADSVLTRLRGGEDFAEMAREYSDDPGSAQLGGGLGSFRPGQMVREFDNVAFALMVDQLSEVVETDFGFHIIRIDRIRLAERAGRHILIAPEMSEADVQRARDLAASLAERARNGESMFDLHEAYSDPLAPDSLTVSIEQLSELPPGYSALQLATPGEVLEPIEYEPSPGQRRFAVVRVREVREAGAVTFEDLRGQLAEQLQQQKQLARILSDLRARTYVEIRM